MLNSGSLVINLVVNLVITTLVHRPHHVCHRRGRQSQDAVIVRDNPPNQTPTIKSGNCSLCVQLGNTYHERHWKDLLIPKEAIALGQPNKCDKPWRRDTHVSIRS